MEDFIDLDRCQLTDKYQAKLDGEAHRAENEELEGFAGELDSEDARGEMIEESEEAPWHDELDEEFAGDMKWMEHGRCAGGYGVGILISNA